MTADEFVRAIKEATPELGDLMGRGYPEVVAREFINGYSIHVRHGAGANSDNPLLDLIARYDTSEFLLGSVHLGGPQALQYLDEGELSGLGLWPVGEEESWPIVLNDSTGEVWLVDPGDLGRRVLRYAASGGQFLDALCEAARFSWPIVAGPPTWKLSASEELAHRAVAEPWAARCAAMAGLDPTAPNPYRSLVGLID
jgi:hypothetical protein